MILKYNNKIRIKLKINSHQIKMINFETIKLINLKH